MGYLFMIVAPVIILSCVGGAIFLLYRAIRYFIGMHFGSGCWALGCSLFLGWLLLALFPFPPHGIKEKARSAICNNNVKSFTLLLKFYAGDHDGKYPVTFNDVVGDYFKAGDLSILICPSSGHQVGGLTNIHAWIDYAYVSGLTEADPSDCVLMFCLPKNHKGEGANVGFLSGRVQWFPCKSHIDSTGQHSITFQELTNTPSLFYGTTNEVRLAERMARTRIIYPNTAKR